VAIGALGVVAAALCPGAFDERDGCRAVRIGPGHALALVANWGGPLRKVRGRQRRDGGYAYRQPTHVDRLYETQAHSSN
jgi:hypothetical protein